MRVVLDDDRAVTKGHEGTREHFRSGDGEVVADVARDGQRAQWDHVDPVQLGELPRIEGVHRAQADFGAQLSSKPLTSGLVEAAALAHSGFLS